ncbi:hypothetical protein BD410DRAFT_258237 [Rickenella mellea]|uniref:Uncharacterized protein n=1 Tax=Rickenella mellea TaxID=50990 RepID=A0A4Y7Q3X0_9AGAM|nr:hypothetical protein BD410DRAFT_258237 [Rickenella mellea]
MKPDVVHVIRIAVFPSTFTSFIVGRRLRAQRQRPLYAFKASAFENLLAMIVILRLYHPEWTWLYLDSPCAPGLFPHQLETQITVISFKSYEAEMHRMCLF